MRWIKWLVSMSCISMAVMATAGEPTYSIPPLSILQPVLIDGGYRIPTPVPRYPVWSYPPQYQYPGALTPIYHGHQQVWPMPWNAQYVRWSYCVPVYPVGRWVPMY